MLRLGVGLPALRWIAIAFPIAFLIAVDVLRHRVSSDPLHSVPGVLVLYGLAALAVAAFAYVVFGLIDALERALTEQNRQLGALNRMAVAATENLRLDDMLSAGLDHVLGAMSADAGLICLVDTTREEHSVVCVRGFSDAVASRIQQAKLRDDPIASEVVGSGRAVVVERVMNDPRVAEAASREGIASFITAPLSAGGEVNGILVVATHEERRFSETDQDFLEGIGGQLGLVIRNALLYEQSQTQNRHLSALDAVGKAIALASDLDQLLERSLDSIVEVTTADAAEIWLPDGEGLAMRCHRGALTEAFLEQTHFRLGEGLPGVVAERRETVAVHDLRSDRRFLRQPVTDAGIQSFRALPLQSGGRLVAVLAAAAFSPEAMTEERELQLFDGIGERLALAIDNAQLQQQVLDIAVLQERERIAREMHDGLAQVLGYINTQTLAVKKLLSDGHLSEAAVELARMEEAARDLYADVREAILGLRTTPHRDGGLIPALREYLDHYSETSGIETKLTVAPDADCPRLAPSADIQLMRIIQEALTNVRKHARATATEVTFEREGDGLRVVVVDDGCGFDRDRLGAAGRPRFGLQTMQERAESVGGRFAVESEPGRGVRVVVHLPLGEAALAKVSA